MTRSFFDRIIEDLALVLLSVSRGPRGRGPSVGARRVLWREGRRPRRPKWMRATSCQSIALRTSVVLATCFTWQHASSAPTGAAFNPEKDLISLHYDHAPDRDDGHSAAADRTILETMFPERWLRRHVIPVSGAYGKNKNSFRRDSDLVMRAAWDEPGGWIAAHDDWNAATKALVKRWARTLEGGGDVWIKEGGQSDISAAAIRAIKKTCPDIDTTRRIHLVQHSNWNENQTSNEALAYVKKEADYIRIKDANRYLNRKGGDAEFQKAALAHPFFSGAWEAAFKYYDPEHRLDFSDSGELMHILGLGELGIDKFRKMFLGLACGPAAEKVVGGFKFTEGPTPDREGNVYFTDIPNNRIHRWSSEGALSTFREDSGGSNGLIFDKDGNLLACEGGRGQVVSITPEGEVTILASKYKEKRFNRPNDLWIDSRGGIYFTDPYYGRGEIGQDGEHVYYLPIGGKAPVRVIDTMTRPNGIIGTPDGKTLYVADHGEGKVFKYRIGDDGSLSDKVFFAAVGCDGIALDGKGNVYLTSYAVQIFNPAGDLIEIIPVPERPSNVCFGGKGMKTLFITARTSLYCVKP